MRKKGLFFLGFITSFAISSCGNDSIESSFSSEKQSSSSFSICSLSEEKRPVWLLGHHCNYNYKGNSGDLLDQEDREVYKAIASGCNGVEVDLAYRSSDNQIVLWHSGEVMANASTLTQFLSLPELADSRMTMVVFDIKDSEYVNEIVNTTHNFYKNDPVNQKIHFVYSVNELSKLKVDDDPYKRFRDVAPLLWSSEALEIDYENDANAVLEMFNNIKFTRGIFGNGIFSGQARGKIENSCKEAISIKYNDISNPYRFKAVESWTVNTLENKSALIYENVGLAERISWGCDMVLLDGFKSLNKDTYSSFYAYKLFNINECVRFATLLDYPFGNIE